MESEERGEEGRAPAPIVLSTLTKRGKGGRRRRKKVNTRSTLERRGEGGLVGLGLETFAEKGGREAKRWKSETLCWEPTQVSLERT